MTRWTLTLIIANVAVFLLTQVHPILIRQLAFVPVEVLERPWTPITYMFLHGSWSHIIFNMLGLFFFGPRIEMFLGEKRFLWLYTVSGLMAAGLSFLFSPLTPIIGASGAVYGIFLGFAYFWPKEMIYIWGVFPIQARWLVVAMTLLSLFGGFSGSSDGIAHFAHLGGFLGAFLYLKWAVRQAVQDAIPKTESVRVSDADLARWAGIDRERLHEVNREELDRIREKIAKGGGTSLTPSEKAFLDRFSPPS